MFFVVATGSASGPQRAELHCSICAIFTGSHTEMITAIRTLRSYYYMSELLIIKLIAQKIAYAKLGVFQYKLRRRIEAFVQNAILFLFLRTMVNITHSSRWRHKARIPRISL